MKGNEEAARGRVDGARNEPLRSQRPFTSERPVHPRVQAIIVVIVAVVVVVFLASISTFGAH